MSNEEYDVSSHLSTLSTIVDNVEEDLDEAIRDIKNLKSDVSKIEETLNKHSNRIHSIQEDIRWLPLIQFCLFIFCVFLSIYLVYVGITFINYYPEKKCYEYTQESRCFFE